MNPNEMIFKLPMFEFKDSSEKDWEKVSEKDFQMKLVENFDPITPILRDMFQGKEFITRNCIYRIKNVSF
jgi:hypothetical protein